MAQHYTSNTVGVMKWCNRCRKSTMHRVSGKRIGLCENDHGKTKTQTDTVLRESEPTLF